ncbi:MAG: phosphodiester glycosidase family protein [Bacteroidales bacterium]|nr:phosphodiester glycosidase family protein [Bacteroidales bacterium]
MKTMCYLLTALLNIVLFSCSGSIDQEAGKLNAPSDLVATQEGNDSAVLSWTNGKGDIEGLYVFCKEDSDSYYVEPSATLPAGTTSYRFTGLNDGYYCFGVQARASKAKNNSDIAWTGRTRILDWSKAPQASIADIKTSYAYLSVQYSFSQLSGTPEDYGVCLSPEHAPTVQDMKIQGPQLQNLSAIHIIPNAILEYGTTYHLRAYVKSGDEYWYSEDKTVSMATEPGIPSLVWNKLAPAGIPSSIEIYETTTALNGRAFHAWYAIADCTKDVSFKVLNPSTKATLEKQAETAGNCYVMINGGIFGTKHIGVIYADGTLQPWRNEVDGSYWGYDEKLYNLTRAIIGTDATGKPAAYWTSAPDASNVFFYDRPMTTVMGGSLWGPATNSAPGPIIAWNPKNAISTGPMLLYNGKCCVDLATNPAGYYITNYECWAKDIYPTKPDRTAVGFTADGRIVLFICDGRIKDSDGAYIDELALIMKGIGCVAAMNLDGGGSTAMIVNGKRLNSLLTGTGTATENRPVLSTLGFFAK